MRETWRWFGPPDAITLAEVRQTGAKGIVSALHHVPSGVAWGADEVAARKAEIEAAGLTWDVIESIPVSEAIKTGTGPWRAHVAAWIDSLRAVVEADGPRVICYNFMPVLDWTRTELRHPVEGGGTAMRFDLTDFAAFDLHLLLRDGAEADYPDDLREMAGQRAAALDTVTSEALAANITAGPAGATESWTLDDVRACLADYAGMGSDDLRRNLITS
jgi:mannonate dehydratase